MRTDGLSVGRSELIILLRCSHTHTHSPLLPRPILIYFPRALFYCVSPSPLVLSFLLTCRPVQGNTNKDCVIFIISVNCVLHPLATEWKGRSMAISSSALYSFISFFFFKKKQVCPVPPWLQFTRYSLRLIRVGSDSQSHTPCPYH